jgi:cytochrome c oxidase subunit 2
MRTGWAAAVCAVLSGCGTNQQSALDAAGVQSERLGNLWWLFFAICTTVYVVVMAVLIVALIRRKKGTPETEPSVHPPAERERQIGNFVKGAVAVTVVTVFVLMVISFRTGKAINSLSRAAEPLTIKVTGHQWWWEVEYRNDDPSRNVLTANEIHIPLGRPVKLELQSNDVIHSFWLPNLHGKRDLIPNNPTTFYLEADKPGVYWGQCAEFCGYQHAKMRFRVTVETQDEFDAWIAAAQRPSVQPASGLQQRGQDLFLTTACAQCHTVQGTPAGAKVGPNLTHIASRPYIGAGSLQNTRENLANWVTDPQKIKPGIRMPMNSYSQEDLNALIEYLESLK